MPDPQTPPTVSLTEPAPPPPASDPLGDAKAARPANLDWRNIFQAIGHPTLIINRDHRILAANRAALQAVHLAEEEILHQKCHQVFHRLDHPPSGCPLTEMLIQEQPATAEMPVETLQGIYQISCTPFPDETGRPAGAIHIAVDVTARKHSELALRMQNDLLNRIMDTSPAGIVMVDRTGKISFANSRAEKVLGLSQKDLFQRTYDQPEWNITDIQGRPLEGEALPFQRVMKSGLPVFDFQHAIVWPNGRRVLLSVNAAPLRDERQMVIGMIATVEDISERLRLESALKENEEKFRVLVEKSPLGVSLVGADGTYKYVNPKFTALFGYTREEVPTGRDWFHRAFPDPAYRRQVIESWKQDIATYRLGESRPRTYTVVTRTGPEKLIHFKPVTLANGDQFVIYEDITEQKRLEEQFLQAQKMEAIGTLAGGIAHDFNNLLTGILGHTSLMRLNTSPAHLHYPHLQAIEEHVKAAADLTRQLLGFARGGQYEVKPTDINDLLQKSLQLFGRTCKEITVHKEFQEGVWTLAVDPGQMTQVFLNLFVNAMQAMPSGGALFVRTANVPLGGKPVAPFGLAEGRYVLITVTDTGQGMDRTTQKRIFEPFYTTKELGRGTGLGLATVYGIIKNHGGLIQVESEPGRGSTFSIYLPAVDLEIRRDPETDHPVLPGRETILLVDDEEVILSVGKEFLEQLGYRVFTAGGGREALARYEEDQARIDLVVLDMVMPQMGGKETFFRLKEINPHIKVLLASGYSAEGPAREILDHGCLGFIQKPMEFNALSARIREIFDRPGSPP